jgi:uncharacterized protein (TIGR02996 family)
MNTDLAILLNALREQPDDEVAYLALSDWCLEHPDAATRARAEHIRLSLELGKLPRIRPRSEKHREMHDRVKSIEQKHRPDWLGPLRHLGHRCDFLPGGLLRLELTAGRTAQAHAAKMEPLTDTEFAWVSHLIARAISVDHLRWSPRFAPYVTADTTATASDDGPTMNCTNDSGRGSIPPTRERQTGSFPLGDRSPFIPRASLSALSIRRSRPVCCSSSCSRCSRP